MFPEEKLRSLITKISSPRWVVPVLPEQELECLLNYAIELTKAGESVGSRNRYECHFGANVGLYALPFAGVDEDCEPCMRFYREGLTISFMKILTDEAVNSWKYNIHFCILNSCGKFMQLCALHLKRDNPHLLDLLAVVLDPENKFNTFNMSRQSDQFTICPAPTVAPPPDRPKVWENNWRRDAVAILFGVFLMGIFFLCCTGRVDESNIADIADRFVAKCYTMGPEWITAVASGSNELTAGQTIADTTTAHGAKCEGEQW